MHYHLWIVLPNSYLNTIFLVLISIISNKATESCDLRSSKKRKNALKWCEEAYEDVLKGLHTSMNEMKHALKGKADFCNDISKL